MIIEPSGYPDRTNIVHDPAIYIDRFYQDVGVVEAEVLALLTAAFGQADSLWPSDQRWLLRRDEQLIAHVAVQQRWFIVNARYHRGWFVGAVCTDPAFRQHGYASHLMQQVHLDLANEHLGFALLNCGEQRVRFYERLGYQRIANRGLYLRQEGHEIDDDPALAIALQDAFDLTSLHCDPFPFGFYF